MTTTVLPWKGSVVGKTLRKAAGRRIDLGRTLHIERLVRPFVVELLVWGQPARMSREAIGLEALRQGLWTAAELGRFLGLTHLALDQFLKDHGVELGYNWEDLERERELHRKLARSWSSCRRPVIRMAGSVRRRLTTAARQRVYQG